MNQSRPNLLEVHELKKYYPVSGGFFKKSNKVVKAVDGVSFNIKVGETLALAGESGCGKTTTAKLILRAIEPTSGVINIRIDEQLVDINQLDRKELREARRHMQMVFQDPYASLNPRMTIREIVAEPLIVQGVPKAEAYERITALLSKVGLDPRYQERYPHAFSGGQRQRIAIARALALQPKLVVADEPVSALDVSIQAQILNLLMDLQEELGLTYLFISHDLSVVEHISDRVGIMYAGKIVEMAETEKIFGQPRHPYTEVLLNAIPRLDPQAKWLTSTAKGEISNKEISGCRFSLRCPYVQEHCHKEEPQLVNTNHGEAEHLVACHYWDKLKLNGV